MSPTVSVLLPTYNAAPYVADAVQSLVDQTYDDFEVLVIDDGSTDATVDIVADYADQDDRIHLLQRDKDDGLAAALNYGLEQADGEYIARQDADDLSAPTRLDQQVRFLEEHSDVALVGTGARLVEMDGNTRGTRHVLENPSREDLAAKNQFVHGSVMMRRSVLEELGGYSEWFEYSEDYDLWLRMANLHDLRNIDQSLYTLRLRTDSIYGDELETVKLYGRYASLKSGLSRQQRRTIEEDIEQLPSVVDVDGLATEMAMELLRYGDVSAARSYCREAMREDDAGVMTWGLYGLSYLPGQIQEAAIRGFRELINTKVRVRNRGVLD